MTEAPPELADVICVRARHLAELPLERGGDRGGHDIRAGAGIEGDAPGSSGNRPAAAPRCGSIAVGDAAREQDRQHRRRTVATGRWMKGRRRVHCGARWGLRPLLPLSPDSGFPPRRRALAAGLDDLDLRAFTQPIHAIDDHALTRRKSRCHLDTSGLVCARRDHTHGHRGVILHDIDEEPLHAPLH
jgi:hypothetical protein